MHTIKVIGEVYLSLAFVGYAAFALWLGLSLRKCDRCKLQCSDGRGCKRQPMLLPFHHGISEVGSIPLHKG